MNHPVDLAAHGLATTVTLSFIMWVASVVRRDASLVDRVWSVFIAAASVAYAFGLGDISPRGMVMLALVVTWSVRLSVYITRRNWGHGEDRRYREIRDRNQPHFALKSLYLIFGLQALLASIISAPVFAGLLGTARWTWLDSTGAAVTLFGIAFEAIADAQMSRFKANPGHAGQVMDKGLWRYTRHPNYFGEACVWWGLWLMALAGGGLGSLTSVISPMLMTLLLVRVSGVSLLEKDIAERRPAYVAYISRTNAFLPGPPKA